LIAPNHYPAELRCSPNDETIVCQVETPARKTSVWLYQIEGAKAASRIRIAGSALSRSLFVLLTASSKAGSFSTVTKPDSTKCLTAWFNLGSMIASAMTSRGSAIRKRMLTAKSERKGIFIPELRRGAAVTRAGAEEAR